MYVELTEPRNSFQEIQKKAFSSVSKFSAVKDILTYVMFSTFLLRSFQKRKVTEFLVKLFTYIEGINCIFIIILLLFILIPDEKFHSSGSSSLKENMHSDK